MVYYQVGLGEWCDNIPTSSTTSLPLPRQIQFIQYFFIDYVIGDFALQ